MEPPSTTDQSIAAKLKGLRAGAGLGLAALAVQSGISRSALWRIENARAGATADQLARLALAYGTTLSGLLHGIDREFEAVVRRRHQELWTDPFSGLRRRTVSPEGPKLAGRVWECELPADAAFTEDMPAGTSGARHLVVLEGRLHVTLGGRTNLLVPVDCLRYRPTGPVTFVTESKSEAWFLLFEA